MLPRAEKPGVAAPGMSEPLLKFQTGRSYDTQPESLSRPQKGLEPHPTVGSAQTLARSEWHGTWDDLPMRKLDISPEAKRRVLGDALEQFRGEDRAIIAATLVRLRPE